MPRVPRGLHSPAGSYAPGRLGWGPASPRPAQRIPVQAYRTPVLQIPLVGGQGQTTVSSAPPAPKPAQVQTATGTATTGTTVTVTLGTPTTTGNCLVAYVGTFGTVANPVVTGITLGGAAGNWGAAKTENSPSGTDAEIWVDWNCAGGQTSVVATFGSGSGTVDMAVRVEEWSNIQNSSSPIDQSSNNFGTSTAPASGTTPSLSQASEVVTGCLAAGGTITGPAAPWNNQTNVNAGAVFMLAGNQVVSATTGLAYAGTTVGSSSWAAVIVSLKAAVPVATGAGLATISVGPQGLGNVWYPASATILTTSGINDFSTCSIYLGPAGIPITLQATIFPGGTGTASLAIPSMTPGQYIIAQWVGANPGDTASLNITGTMDSVMPG